VVGSCADVNTDVASEWKPMEIAWEIVTQITSYDDVCSKL
jgi:hypothetical protein